jgi:hypothetical protein
MEPVWPAQLQPRFRPATVRTSAHCHEHPDGACKSPRGRRNYLSARWIQPLQIIDGQEHRRRFGEALDDREKSRAYRALIGDRAIGTNAEKYAVDCQALWRW